DICFLTTPEETSPSTNQCKRSTQTVAPFCAGQLGDFGGALGNCLNFLTASALDVARTMLVGWSDDTEGAGTGWFKQYSLTYTSSGRANFGLITFPSDSTTYLGDEGGMVQVAIGSDTTALETALGAIRPDRLAAFAPLGEMIYESKLYFSGQPTYTNYNNFAR